MAVASDTAAVCVSLSRQQHRWWSQHVCWEQNLPTNVCFAEKEEGAQAFQTGRRGVNHSAHRRAAAATLQRTVDAAAQRAHLTILDTDFTILNQSTVKAVCSNTPLCHFSFFLWQIHWITDNYIIGDHCRETSSRSVFGFKLGTEL